MSIRRTLTTAAAAATFAAALTAAAGSAAAQEPTQLAVADCAFGSGTLEAFPGPAVGFITGWGSGTRGLVTSFLASQETTVTVQYDGEPPTTLDLSGAWTTPVYNEEFGLWTTELLLPLGDLEVGDVVVISIDSVLKTPVMDFARGEEGYNFPPVGGNLVPAGTELAGTCTITVVEDRSRPATG